MSVDAKTSACMSAVTSEVYDLWVRLIILSLSLFLNIVQHALVLIYLRICGRILAGSFNEETMAKWSDQRLSIFFIFFFEILIDTICR